jgi:16S rRNA (adenine1518-N6/adenine1519-N6)-dimethyltransferase
MQSLTDIRAMLAERGLRPRKRYGQNFLHDQNKIRMLIDAAAIEPGEIVLEVGPGTGALTEALLEAGAQVFACEIDRDLAAIVERRLAEHLPKSVHAGLLMLIVGDCLEHDRRLNPSIVEHLRGRPFKLVANLPYNAASPLITTLLIEHDNCRGQFVTIQREVADRLLAQPSTKAYGPLSIIVQAMASVRRITTLPPSCFWPEPQVDSAMVAILPSPSGRAGGGDEINEMVSASGGRDFAQFITQLFTKRRKQLGTILGRHHLNWPAGVTARLRPEALTVEQLVRLWTTTTRQDS